MIKDTYNNKHDGLMMLIRSDDKLCNQLFRLLGGMLDLAVKEAVNEAVYPILSRYRVYH